MWPSKPTPAMVARPIETATGTVRPKNSSMEMTINCDMALPRSDGFDVGPPRAFGPVGQRGEQGQRGPHGNGQIDPRNGDAHAGRGLEPDAPGHVGPDPDQKTQETDDDQQDDVLQHARPTRRQQVV